MRYHKLSPEERAIIEFKGTESPLSGSLYKHSETGIYICRRCDSALYLSSRKFASNCGWPSFDQELPGSVRRLPDSDGRRTEILCRHCGAHLGHVFFGERLTEKNTRHCVNSTSMAFAPLHTPNGLQRALLAGGCFWGIEYFFKNMKGVVAVTSGYIGGDVAFPSYEEVCTGESGHAEAVEIQFDEHRTNYTEILKTFFEVHDPQQVMRQGPDIGSQYRSAIFYLSQEQCSVAKVVIALLEQREIHVATEVVPAMRFYPAEKYHQNYCQKTGRSPYCHTRVKRFE